MHACTQWVNCGVNSLAPGILAIWRGPRTAYLRGHMDCRHAAQFSRARNHHIYDGLLRVCVADDGFLGPLTRDY